MSVNVTLLRALTVAANSLRFNPEIAPEDAEIYERLLVELRDELSEGADKKCD